MEISPAVLEFSGPFTQTVTRTLHLHNKTPDPMAYKVKTTAPKLYCVRPNASRVNPGEVVDVSIILQGLKQEPSEDFKCKDKFLVQSVPITPEQETLTISDLWSTVEKTAKNTISDCKIRVHYQIPQSHSLTPSSGDTNGTATAVDTSAGANEYTTPSNPANGINRRIVSEASDLGFEPSTAVEAMDSKEEHEVEDATKKLESQLDQSRSPAVTVSSPSTSGGVPIHIVVILCLAAFLLAWLFS
ncbi:PapD-like protein [Dipodascopsis uninucleata]